MTRWHELPVRVYFEDTDAQGVVYFANYLKFMERGRTEWLRERGVEHDALRESERLCFTVTDTSVRFLKPARFNDQLKIRTRLLDRGRVRFVLEQAVHRHDEELLCSARCTVACIDAVAFRPRRIPRNLARTLAGEPDQDLNEEGKP